MRQPSEKVRQVQRSGIRVIMEAAARIPAAIHLEVGQPDMPTPPHIVDAACRAAREGYHFYAPNAGLMSLRQAIVEKLRREKAMNVAVGNVVVTPGSVTALATGLVALIDHGDEVLVPDPGWPNYAMAVQCAGGMPVRYPLAVESGFQPDLGAVERAVSDRTRAIIANSPSNPTGAVFSAEAVRGLAEIARRHDLWLLSDEVYERIVFDGSHVGAAQFDDDERVVSVFGMSKSYAMTGWRVGYAVAREDVAAQMTKLQEAYVSSTCTVSQKAAEAALLGPQDCVDAMVAAYRERRDAVCDLLEQHGRLSYRPSGAFYILVDISDSGLDSDAFARRLLDEEKVAVAPGATFGPSASGWVRLSLATSRDLLEEGVRRLCRFLR